MPLEERRLRLDGCHLPTHGLQNRLGEPLQPRGGVTKPRMVEQAGVRVNAHAERTMLTHGCEQALAKGKHWGLGRRGA